MKLIPRDKYAEIIKVLPILCVDIIVQNACKKYLLVKRANEPKKNKWWVIGGRVFKGETLKCAVKRKVKEEIGLRIKDIQAIGYFELLNSKHPFGLSCKYHAVSIVFKANINGAGVIILDDQSTGFKFAKKLPADFRIEPFGVNCHHNGGR